LFSTNRDRPAVISEFSVALAPLPNTGVWQTTRLRPRRRFAVR
jgi:hypothetical protein